MADIGVPPCFVDVREPSEAPNNQPPAVLIHGWASGSAYWEPSASKLVERGQTVWILDLPGYHAGQELPQDFEWTLETAAASVGATIGRMTSGPVHLVGHSMGGSVALTLAAARPDLVATLTLVGMVPAPPNAGFRNLIREQLEQGHFDAGFVGKCMRAWYGDLPAEDEEKLRKGFDLPFRVLAPSALAAMTGVGPSIPGRVLAPLLVIAGVGDRVRSIDQMADFAAAAPGRQLKAVENAGHSVHWEQPEACAVTLMEFWKTSRPLPA
ncbi:MAG: alpha/beta hydrolase [Paenarthrobacter ureafaciens]|uniref:alpha/beta fold hydrolase n=1 Tax=Paenarthrobacter ureafaciens TaxID=37931 RepID=UPI001ACBF101|nr:alpha/beta hydrolase [Paenarthrobacter ureafaciens]MBN9130310.1 alpha/beta hydrolase [Paenarthrobacter ureafaciens]